MKNGVLTGWDMARFGVVQQYYILRVRNEREGIGNGHLLPPSEFASLINNSKSTFDPYRYLEEMQRNRPKLGALAISESSSADHSQDQNSSTTVVAKKSFHALSAWDIARFCVVQEYDDLRARNDMEGIGNAHLLPTIEFVHLMNNSNSTFDPYLYMREMQRNRPVSAKTDAHSQEAPHPPPPAAVASSSKKDGAAVKQVAAA